MRLYLLPISTRRTLLYAERQRLDPSKPATLVERVTARANKQWVQWEAAEKGWQKKVTDWGNQAFARIPYQEWGLKSVPPLSTKRKDIESQEAKENKQEDKVVVVFPRGVMAEGDVTRSLRALSTERQGLHRKWMWWSIIGMPFSAPFALIPIVPNLPFFYLVFRAWSHWRALSGSKHIEHLLDKQLLQPQPSPPLQKAYEVRTITPEQMEKLKAVNAEELSEEARMPRVLEIIDRPGETHTVKSQNWEEKEEILLEKRSGKLVARVVKLPGLDVEIERAVDQINRSMAKEEREAKEEDKKKETQDTQTSEHEHEKKQ